MQIGNKIWSGAPGTLAREVRVPAVQTKGLTIVNDGFVSREMVSLAEAVTGRQQEGFDANVIMAPVAWIMRTFPDAVARVKRHDGDQWDWVDGHDVQRLIRRPNAWYNGDALWQATCLSYVLNGNGYWEKIRNRFGQVVQLWYRPHWTMRPHTPPDGSAFIDYYLRDTGRGIVRLNVRDVVHFRFGLDPRDPRFGYGPLRSLLGEMLTDQEAARFSMRILENMGIPGVVVSPTLNPTGDSFEPPPGEIQALKDYIDTAFTGNGRGSTLVFAQPTTVAQFGFDPSKLTLSDLRNMTEERVCAMLAVPAAVVGFRSGMAQTKVGATMAELVKLAWKQCLFPMQRSLARQLDEQLLSDFVPDYEDRERIEFDISEAASLKEDAGELTDRVVKLVGAGVLRVDRAQGMLGMEVDDSQQVYLRPLTIMPVPADTVPEPMAPPGADTGEPTPAAKDDRAALVAAVFKDLATNGSGNGNGHEPHAEDA